MPLDAQLLKVLVCPSCRAALGDGENGEVACTSCDLSYPVTDGIPVLLVDSARRKTER